MIFLLKTLRDSKVMAAKDHGKKFRSKPSASFVGIVHRIVENGSSELTSLDHSTKRDS